MMNEHSDHVMNEHSDHVVEAEDDYTQVNQARRHVQGPMFLVSTFAPCSLRN